MMNPSVQLCAGHRVKTEALVWDCRLVRVLTGLLDLDVRPVSSQLLGFSILSESRSFKKVIAHIMIGCFLVGFSGV